MRYASKNTIDRLPYMVLGGVAAMAVGIAIGAIFPLGGIVSFTGFMIAALGGISAGALSVLRKVDEAGHVDAKPVLPKRGAVFQKAPFAVAFFLVAGAGGMCGKMHHEAELKKAAKAAFEEGCKQLSPTVRRAKACAPF